MHLLALHFHLKHSSAEQGVKNVLLKPYPTDWQLHDLERVFLWSKNLNFLIY